MDNELYVLVDEPVKDDDEIMNAIAKHMKTKRQSMESPVLSDSYGDLSVYSQGLQSFMSKEAQSQLYGDGSVVKLKKQPIREKLLLALASQPDAWLSVKEVAVLAGVKLKSAQEGLKALYAQRAVSRRFLDDNDARKGFAWQHQAQAEQVSAVTDAEFDEPERTELESLRAEQEMAAAVEQEAEREVPSKADAKPDYAVFLTAQGQEQVVPTTTLPGSLEPAPEVHVEQDQQALSDAEVQADLKGIFQDDYFAQLVNRVVVDGPARIHRKITILRTLSLLLSKHSRCMDYGRELMEVAEYLSSIDELQHYY